MKFALMVMGELRAVHKNIANITERIINYYNADVIIVCQNAFQDDDKRIELFKHNVAHVHIYDKPDPLTYFGDNSCVKDVSVVGGDWNTFGCLQIYINMKEMADIILKHELDYDYYLMFRTDSSILFDLPPVDIFNEAPSSVYGFYTDYWKDFGNLGGHYIHKNYINNYLTAPYTYIKNTNNFKILNEKQMFQSLNTLYFFEIENLPRGIAEIIYQEVLFILAFEAVGITINKIRNLPFYYIEDINENYTFNNTHRRITSDDVCYKYLLQYNECNQNLLCWTNGHRWKLVNNEIKLI